MTFLGDYGWIVAGVGVLLIILIFAQGFKTNSAEHKASKGESEKGGGNSTDAK